MAIRLFATGGTIDCEKIDPVTEKYIFTETHLPKMLKQARITADISLEVLMLRYSPDMTESEKNLILEKCQSCQEDKIVITHGTIAMTATAQFLGQQIRNKTIVLLGSIIPYNQRKSDALFNLGSAITAVQLLPKGVYIVMNGRIFSWDNVRKNEDLQEFEELQHNKS